MSSVGILFERKRVNSFFSAFETIYNSATKTATNFNSQQNANASLTVCSYFEWTQNQTTTTSTTHTTFTTAAKTTTLLTNHKKVSYTKPTKPTNHHQQKQQPNNNNNNSSNIVKLKQRYIKHI